MPLTEAGLNRPLRNTQWKVGVVSPLLAGDRYKDECKSPFFAMEVQLNNSTSNDDPAVLAITALVRLATDTDGSGPSAGAIRNYVIQGLLQVAQDSTGRLLFRRSDAKKALQIYQARKARHGATGRRAPANARS
jgi:hypothetical protein